SAWTREAKVRTEIDASNERFLEELARGDATAAATAYAEGAILLPPSGEIIRGRKAIESFWRSGIEIGVRTDLETLERDAAHPFVYEVGRYRMLFQRAEDGLKCERCTYLLLYR